MLSWLSGIGLGLFTASIGYLAGYSGEILHFYLALSLAMTCTPPALYYTFTSRRMRAIDDGLPRILDDIVGSWESGLTLLEALEEVSKRRYGPLTKELRKTVAQISWGVPFEKAMESFAKRAGTELAVRVMMLIAEAARMGGDIKGVFKSTSTFVKKVLELRKEREAQLRPFIIVTYVTVAVFIVVMLILYYGFFLPLASPTGEVRFLKIPLSLEEYKLLIFDMGVIEAFFGGLLAGKLSEGKIIAGFKHVVVLILTTATILGLTMLLA